MKAIYNIGRESIPYAKEAIKGTLKAVTNTPTTEVMLNKNCHEIEDRIDISPKKEAFSFNKMFSYKPSLSQQVAKNIFDYQNYQRFEQNSGLNTLSRSFSSLNKPRIDKMERFADPTNDFAFKKIYSDKDDLKNFLNNVVVSKNQKIIDLEYKNVETASEGVGGRKSVFDIKIVATVSTETSGVKNTEEYIIEMQRNTILEDYSKRVQYYSSHSIVQQIKEGDRTYSNLIPTIIVSVLKKSIFPEDVPCISFHKITEQETHKSFLDKSSYVFIELDKFKDEDKYDENIKEWLHLLKYAKKEDHIPDDLKNESVKHAYKTLESVLLSDTDRDSYLRADIAEQADINSKKIIKAEGKAEGKAELIKKMLDKGKSTEEIIELTDLTKDEIEKIKNTDLLKEK